MINPVHLRTFNKLIEVGHFTRTAELLFMTQSGVSQHIKRLEQYLKVDLLHRQGKGFYLTEAGERLHIESQKILQSLIELDENVRFDSPYEGPVRVASPGSVGLKIYDYLTSWQQQHPKLMIDYRFAPNSDVEGALHNAKADIGLTTTSSNHPSLQSNLIATEQLLLVTPASVPDVSWETLLTLGFIDHPDGAHHAKLLLSENYDEFQHISMFTKKGFSNQIGLILEPVSKGLGFTVLPAFAVNAFAQQQLISVFELQTPVQENIYLVLRKDKVLSARINHIIERIELALSK